MFTERDPVMFADGDIPASFAEPVYSGNALAPAVAPREAAGKIVRVHLTTTDLNGMPVQQIAVGDSFLLNASVEDARPEGQGVFVTYLDVLYDSGLVAVNGIIQHSDVYSAAPKGDTATSGRINEAGSFSPSLAPVGKGTIRLFSIPMRALAAGTTLLAADPAECRPFTDIGVYGMDAPVPGTAVVFGQTTLKIGERSDRSTANVDELAEAAPDRCSMHVQRVAPSAVESSDIPTVIVPYDAASDSQLRDIGLSEIDHTDKRRRAKPRAAVSFPALDSSFVTPIAASTPSSSQPSADMDSKLPPDESLESSYAIFAQLAEMFPLP
jgi:hypothetical protein